MPLLIFATRHDPADVVIDADRLVVVVMPDPRTVCTRPIATVRSYPCADVRMPR